MNDGISDELQTSRLPASVSQSSIWHSPLSSFTSRIAKCRFRNPTKTPYTLSVFPGGSKWSLCKLAASFLLDRAVILDIRVVPADMTAFFGPFNAATPPTEPAATAAVSALRDVCALTDFSADIPVSSVMASNAEAVKVVAKQFDRQRCMSNERDCYCQWCTRTGIRAESYGLGGACCCEGGTARK